jgi:hypothetical protein
MRFQKGIVANPAGRPRGTRNRLSNKLLEDMCENWQKNGKAALEIMFKEKPSEYVRAMLSVLPREFVFEEALADFGDEDIDHLLEAIRLRVLERKGEKAQLAPALPTPTEAAH